MVQPHANRLPVGPFFQATDVLSKENEDETILRDLRCNDAADYRMCEPTRSESTDRGWRKQSQLERHNARLEAIPGANRTL